MDHQKPDGQVVQCLISNQDLPLYQRAAKSTGCRIEILAQRPTMTTYTFDGVTHPLPENWVFIGIGQIDPNIREYGPFWKELEKYKAIP